MTFHFLESKYYRETELARLLVVLVTPDPTTGARSTSASANGHTYFKELAKDTLICALDALAQSSDAFPPLKSAAGGLMFFATLADVSTHVVSDRLVLIRLFMSACLQQQRTDARDVQANRETSQILQDHFEEEHSVHPRATGHRRCTRRVRHIISPPCKAET